MYAILRTHRHISELNKKQKETAEWEQMKKDVTQGGAAIIKLRGRSSFQILIDNDENDYS